MKTALVAVSAGFLFCSTGRADDESDRKADRGVSYLSGGIGEVEQAALRAVQAQYNVHLMFAVKGSKEFEVPDRIRIKDARGVTLLDVPASGPYFYAKLKPGHYKVAARRGNDVVSETVRVDENRSGLLNFSFPQRSGE